ncbi:hypothetical protein PMAYCL1PPCAC_03840, partial [Pristionchus mayeri]
LLLLLLLLLWRRVGVGLGHAIEECLHRLLVFGRLPDLVQVAHHLHHVKYLVHIDLQLGEPMDEVSLPVVHEHCQLEGAYGDDMRRVDDGEIGPDGVVNDLDRARLQRIQILVLSLRVAKILEELFERAVGLEADEAAVEDFDEDELRLEQRPDPQRSQIHRET